MKIEENPSPMPFKVNKVPPGPSQPPAADQVRRVHGKKRGDVVTLSKTAETIATAARRVKAMPDVDMTKVAEVKAKLQDGTYQADAEKAASNMLAESLLRH